MVKELSGTLIISNPVSGYRSLEAIQYFKQGEVLSKFGAFSTSEVPTRYTLQVGEKKHIVLDPPMLQYINHSCKPNLFFDTKAMEVICIEDIKAGSFFTYFYPSTEWQMGEIFHCNCGARDCLKEIKGASYLSPEELKKYRFTDFILKKLHFPPSESLQ